MRGDFAGDRNRRPFGFLKIGEFIGEISRNEGGESLMRMSTSHVQKMLPRLALETLSTLSVTEAVSPMCLAASTAVQVGVSARTGVTNIARTAAPRGFA